MRKDWPVKGQTIAFVVCQARKITTAFKRGWVTDDKSRSSVPPLTSELTRI